jgi:hypothetical protein
MFNNLEMVALFKNLSCIYANDTHLYLKGNIFLKNNGSGFGGSIY